MTRRSTWLLLPLVAALGLALGPPAVLAEPPSEIEWEPGEGYHEEEWYDPSDWFDIEGEGVSYEYDYYDGHYTYDYGGYPHEAYDYEPDWDDYAYYEAYDYEPDYDDYYAPYADEREREDYGYYEAYDYEPDWDDYAYYDDDYYGEAYGYGPDGDDYAYYEAYDAEPDRDDFPYGADDEAYDYEPDYDDYATVGYAYEPEGWQWDYDWWDGWDYEYEYYTPAGYHGETDFDAWYGD